LAGGGGPPAPPRGAGRPAAAGGRRRFRVGPVTWVSEAPPETGGWQSAEVQLRAHAPARPARYRLEQGDPRRLEVELEEPLRAITPGQSAVLYRGEEVLAGGPVREVLE
ncbi:MAG: hypothetical protein IRZ26_07745, partial [Clostridia bacterium]|nr:hypothetical protein [Clostridia bacterium]